MNHSATRAPLRVVFVGAHDSSGGAARALTRLFMMLYNRQEELGLDLTMRVVHKTIDHPAIIGGKPTRNRREYARYFLRTRFRKYFPRKKFVSNNTLLHSQALHHSGMGKELLAMDADLYVLNWLGNGTLSIPEVGKLHNKALWQLYDMWMFSGAEHYTDENRAQVGYTKKSRPGHESGPDIDRETFLRKKRHWRTPRPILSPSTWLANEAKKSTLTATWPIHVIPYPLDTDFWHPVDKKASRVTFGLPGDHKIVLFGASEGTRLPYKGVDLLFDALELVKQKLEPSGLHDSTTVAIFGEKRDPITIGGLPVVFLGELDNEGLRAAYSAADVMIVPSRLEAFGQVASEAHSCALPVIVFENTGLTDIVGHEETGLHAKKNNPRDLADSIASLLADDAMLARFSAAAREKAVRLWSEDVVAPRYAKLLHDAAPDSL